MKQNLKSLLIQYLKEHPGFHKKVDLFVLGDRWGYSPETIGRKLREAHEEGSLGVEYYNGTYSKNLAKYCYGKPVEKKLQIIVRDGRAIRTYV